MRYLLRVPSLRSLSKTFPSASLEKLSSLRDRFLRALNYRDVEIAFEEFSDALGFGVDTIRDHDGRPVLDYCNMGEMYQPTLLWYSRSPRCLRIGSWGDAVEAFERRYHKLP